MGSEGNRIDINGCSINENEKEKSNAIRCGSMTDAERKAMGERKKYGFDLMTAQAVQDYISEKKAYIVEGLITPGLNILSACRKTGKSWLALYLATVVAGEGDFWGRPTEHGRVLYMALEDTVERIKERMNYILENEDAPERLLFTYKVEGTGKRIQLGIRSYIEDNPDIKLIIIDVLQKLRTDKAKNQTEYSHDYEELSGLKEIADNHGIAILVVTHNRKTVDNNNRMNNIAGGVGVTAVADTILMLEKKKDSSEGRLFIDGRDVPQVEMVISQNSKNFRWEYVKDIGDSVIEAKKAVYESSLAVRAVKKLLEDNGGQWTGTSSELLEYGRKEFREEIAKGEQALGRILNSFGPLFKEDSIIHIKPDKNGGAGGRKHIFKTASRIEQSETDGIRNEPGICTVESHNMKVLEYSGNVGREAEMEEDEDIPFDMDNDSEELPFS